MFGGWRIFWLSLTILVLAALLSRPRFSETSATVILVLSVLVPPLIGFFGWLRTREIVDPRECGQLQVAQRVFPGSDQSSRRLGSLAVDSVTAAAPSEIHLALTNAQDALLRVFSAATHRQDVAPAQTSVAASAPDKDPIPLANLEPARRRERWIYLEAPLPSGTGQLFLQTTSGPAGSPSVFWGNPLVFEPRPRTQSKVCFVMPEANASLPSYEQNGRLRILLTMNAQALRGEFDEVHFASEPREFSTRMLALARTLYRRATVLVLEPREQNVAERQLDLLKREFGRLGLSEKDVVVETCGSDRL